MVKFEYRITLLSIFIPVFFAATANAQSSLLLNYADLVLSNGQVLSVDENFTIHEAIAVRDGRVLALGSSNEILALAGPDTQHVDLNGRTVTPGYIYNDGDNSVPGGDIYKDTMVKGWLSGRIPGASLEELLASLNKLTEESDAGAPIFVNMPKASPRVAEEWTADDLDEIAPSNPMALFYNDSVVVVNHAMLNDAFAAGLPKEHFGVVLNEDAEATGQLFQQAAGVYRLAGPPLAQSGIYRQRTGTDRCQSARLCQHRCHHRHRTHERPNHQYAQ